MSTKTGDAFGVLVEPIPDAPMNELLQTILYIPFEFIPHAASLLSCVSARLIKYPVTASTTILFANAPPITGTG